MKYNKLNVERILLGILLLYLISLLGTISEASGKTVSETVTIQPVSHHVVSFKMRKNDPLEISIQVLSGKIDLYIFNSENYPIPTYYERLFYDIYSTFSTTFDAPYTDTWYLEFWNGDNANTAQITITLEHVQTFLTNTITHLSVGLGFLAVIIVINFIGKK
ncbi:MAG: hypothetical protein GF308_10230 [Candidatus Heimdallarchaeota archaeon]|nr:hypothetical protein [Candidatus Heimdallarchaeota archaeon]